MEDAEAAADRRLAVADGIPGQPEPRREVLERRVVVPRDRRPSARGSVTLRRFEILPSASVGVGDELVAQADVGRQRDAQADVVLQEGAEEPLAILRRSGSILPGTAKSTLMAVPLQEALEVREVDDAADLAGGVLVELQVLRLEPDARSECRPRVRMRVLPTCQLFSRSSRGRRKSPAISVTMPRMVR